jgi:hypothetical protein
MEHLPEFGEQEVEGLFSGPPSDLPDELSPVAEWLGIIRTSLIDPIPADKAQYQAALAAETVRLAAQAEAAPGHRGWRRRLHLSGVPLRLAGQLAVILFALIALAGGVAAAAGVDVPALITRPFFSPGHSGEHSNRPDDVGPVTSFPESGDVDDDAGPTTTTATTDIARGGSTSSDRPTGSAEESGWPPGLPPGHGGRPCHAGTGFPPTRPCSPPADAATDQSSDQSSTSTSTSTSIPAPADETAIDPSTTSTTTGIPSEMVGDTTTTLAPADTSTP